MFTMNRQTIKVNLTPRLSLLQISKYVDTSNINWISNTSDSFFSNDIYFTKSKWFTHKTQHTVQIESIHSTYLKKKTIKNLFSEAFKSLEFTNASANAEQDKGINFKSLWTVNGCIIKRIFESEQLNSYMWIALWYFYNFLSMTASTHLYSIRNALSVIISYKINLEKPQREKSIILLLICLLFYNVFFLSIVVFDVLGLIRLIFMIEIYGRYK